MSITRVEERCQHGPFEEGSTLIVESHWAAGSRIRCKVCGGCAAISGKGRIKPETRECHSAAEALAS